MNKKTEIDITNWNDALSGKSKNPLGNEEIKKMARNGGLIIVGTDGQLFDPVEKDNGEWNLEPISTI